MNWRITLTLALLVGALVSGWSAWRQGDAQAALTTTDGRTDYLLRDFDLVALDAQGQEAFSVAAPRLLQTPGARSLEIETPVFHIPAEDGSGRWQVVSTTGWVSEDNEEVRLRGEVTATSPDAAPRPTTMRTEALDLYPQRNQAGTETAVVVTQPGTTMQGIGMRADLDSGRIELLSQVRFRNEHTPRR
ncbi:LPS export ABC transporter periplasmic protein LptC [Luteimonas deserti]|uniref:Lipopolysaccharide export system protein LptC n=1 Tax=Luteimonas deserti TaxID=2752306 RepID=A0A7Z0QUG5_9GAMM|nr:LPS export ABC transporter periplasmic protein LptC [Luteimonas deserti]NYZ63648.1 LPS export ABC transporter periplasmic protein LptC [Luteimonas deserti]